ncbi:cysteine proteinase [Xylariaceae sp. FL0804]|nr:cysteine proteinase [Xylariaceae sp. FL0804]
MHSPRFERQVERPDFHASKIYSHHHHPQRSPAEWLLQPSVVLPLVVLLFTVFYQYSPLSSRNPLQLVWDITIAITPARLLYAIDDFLHPPLFPIPQHMLPARSSSYTAKSQVLHRILGMDKPGSLMNAVASAGRRSLSSLSASSFAKRSTDQPPGLGNHDNSCFQNSILQGLSSLQPLPAYLESALEQRSDDKDSGSAATLRELISNLTDADNNGTTLWTPKKLKSLDAWQQQDAQEYYSKILDEIDKEIARAARSRHRPAGLDAAGGDRDDTGGSQHSDDSGYQSLSVSSKASSDAKHLINPLEGLTAQRVACVQCGYSQGLSLSPFNCLTLSLGLGQGTHDLYERLDHYTDLETIEGVECPKCTLLKVQRLLNLIVSRGRQMGTSDDNLREPLSRLEAVGLALEEDDFEEGTLAEKCKISKQHRVNSTKTKQMVIARPPQSLAVHVNRSVFDETTGNLFKNFAAMRFPVDLNLGPWCLGSAGPLVSDGEHWLMDPRSSMVSGDLKPSRISGPMYQLRAVVTHQGRHENGHYVCYRRHPYHAPKANGVDEEEPRTLSGDDSSAFQSDEGTLVESSSQDEADSLRSNPDSRWWRLSDESVWEVSEESVLAQDGVFMLFYDCVDRDSFLVPHGHDENGTMRDEGAVGTHVTGEREDIVMLDASGQFYEAGSSPTSATASPAARPTAQETNKAVRPKAAGMEDTASQEQSRGLLGSSLLPLLGDRERVDSSIPLYRPNS